MGVGLMFCIFGIRRGVVSRQLTVGSLKRIDGGGMCTLFVESGAAFTFETREVGGFYGMNWLQEGMNGGSGWHTGPSIHVASTKHL